MSFESPIILSPLHLIGQDFFPLTLLDDLPFDDDIGQVRRPELRLTFFGDHEDIFLFHLIPYFSFQFFYPDEVSFGDPVFLSTCFHHRIHQTPPNQIIIEY